MLGKILLTLAVILGAIVVIRKRQHMDAEAQRNPAGAAPLPDSGRQQDSELASDLRIGAYLFLVLMVGLGAALYYYRWQDDHTIVTVNLHRDGQAAPVSYQVYKFQLAERSFTTVDGISVNVASSERMEVLGLE